MGGLLTAHFWLYFGKTKGDFMDDYRPIITQEEWEQFVQEFGLELAVTKTDDVDDFFQRLENDFDGSPW